MALARGGLLHVKDATAVACVAMPQSMGRRALNAREAVRSIAGLSNPGALARIRGPDGRYILPEQKENQLWSPSNTGVSDTLAATDADRSEYAPAVMKTTRDPEIPLNLARLVGADHESHSGDESADRRETISPDGPHNKNNEMTEQDNARSNFVGESWYASYVLSTSAAGHSELHRPIERGQSSSAYSSPADGGSVVIDSRKRRSATKVPPSDLPSQHLTERLLEVYFQRFHVFCPILDRGTFLSSVRDGSVSITLLRSVLYIASVHCGPEIFHLMGYTTRLDAGDDLFSKACASFDADYESDRTTMVLASYLLHYYFGKPTSYRDTLWWLGNAIRSAECMGYHRSTKNSKMDARQKAQWKRIWWCLYIRDRQVCLSTGPPMSINDLDCDVEDLTMEDFPDESPETAQYIIGQVSLNKIDPVSNMFYCHCSPSRLSLSRDPSVRQIARREIQAAMEDWCAHASSSWEENHYLTLTLKVCYYYYIINLQQRLQRLCHKPFADHEGSTIVLEAASHVTTLVEDSLLYWSPEHFPMIYVSAIFSAMTAYVAEGGISDPSQLSQKLRPSLLALKQFEQYYIVARWIRNLLMDLTSRLNKTEARKRGHRPDDARIYRQVPSFRRQHGIESHSQTQFTDNNEQRTQPTENAYVADNPGSGGDASSYVYETSPFDPSFESPSGTSAAVLGSFLPDFMTNDFISQQFSPDGNGTIEFPSPSSFEYQHLHFLADLGLSGLGNPAFPETNQ
ncbi:fungal-specific transcription factor domain-containing protein [Exophiala viscosa]|uniref:Fungal-specific transcription factor domain-containing protein n=1 Tax=Exophiala viscosa TaxID=2486360 RepID=A0AAN6DRP3_9EURO|nr:fungal-specific transcription factor domain-containing protein [Exophiala viscosa]